MATKYTWKFRTGNNWTSPIDFGQVIIDNPTNPLLTNAQGWNADDFQTYVESPLPNGLNETIDTELDGMRYMLALFDIKTNISGLNYFYKPLNSADGEMLRWDEEKQDIIGTGDINTNDLVNFGDKTVQAGTGTFKLAQAQEMTSSGIDVNFIDLITGEVRSSVDVVYPNNVPEMNKCDKFGLVSGWTVISDDLLDPSWDLVIIENTSIESFQFWFTGDFPTYARIALQRNGVEVWSDKLSGFVDSIKTYQLKAPVQILNDGATYSISITNGATMKGQLSSGRPYYNFFKRKFYRISAQTLPSGTSSIKGGFITKLSDTEITVDTGEAYIMDGTDSGNVTTEFVRWDTQTVPISVVQDVYQVISATNGGALEALNIGQMPDDYHRTHAILGFIQIQSSVIVNVVNMKYCGASHLSQSFELYNALGTFRESGLTISPNAALTFAVSSGRMHAIGAGIAEGNTQPNIVTVDAVAPASFARRQGIANVIETADTTLLDPTKYEDQAGVLQTILGIKFTIQYIFKFPVNAGGIQVIYGQNEYISMDEAKAGAPIEQMTLPFEVTNSANLIERVILKNSATDLTDPSEAYFLGGAKFGSSIIGGIAGGVLGGGDMFGAATSKDKEVVTFSGTSGKTARTGADISSDAGVIQRITANEDITFKTNGTGAIVEDIESSETMEVRTGVDGDANIIVTQAGVPVAKICYEDATKLLQMAGFSTSFGLKIDTENSHSSIGDTLRTGNWLLALNDTTGLFGLNRISTAQANALIDGNSNLYRGGSWYDETLDAFRCETKTGSHDFANTALQNALTPSATVELNFEENKKFSTLLMSQTTTFTFSNARLGHEYELELSGNFPYIMPTEFNQLNLSEVYDGSKVNTVRIICINEDTPEFIYSITKPFAGGVLTVDQPVDTEVVVKTQSTGYNTTLILTNKALYSTHGDSTSLSFTGRGTASDQPDVYGLDRLTPVSFDGKENDIPIDFTASQSATLVLFADGELWGWGRNSNGQLGLGDTVARYKAELLRTNVTQIIAGVSQSHYSPVDATMFIKQTDGFIYATGRNKNGCMGLIDISARNLWTQLSWIGADPIHVFNFGTTYGFTLVQKADQSLWFAGFDGFGQSGFGSVATSRSTPIEVTEDWFGVGNSFDIIDAVAGCGYFSTAAISSSSMHVLYNDNGTTVLKGSGSNDWGQLGNGTTTNSSTPIQVTPEVGTIKQISGAGGAPITIGVLYDNGNFYSFGHNAQGQVGVAGGSQLTPVLVKIDIDSILTTGYASNTYSYYVSMFIRGNNGFAYGTGYNERGQIGIGRTTTNITGYSKCMINEKIKAVFQYPYNHDGRHNATVFISDTNKLYVCGEADGNGALSSSTGRISSPISVRFPV